MVVLDHQYLGATPEEQPQLGPPARLKRRPKRILRPGGAHYGVCAPPQRRLEGLWHQSVVIDWHPDLGQPERGQQVAQRWVGGILDQHPIPGSQVRAQNALDPVKRSRHHADPFAPNTITLERGRGEREQVGVVGIQAGDVERPVEIDAFEGRS